MSRFKSQKSGWNAVIDMGTNTFQLLIAKVENGNLISAYRTKRGVQIGKGGMSRSLILPEAVDRAVATLSDFNIKVDEFGLALDECIVLATSAFRNASNLEEVVKKIFHDTGFAVSVIDGNVEAELIYKGVMASRVTPAKGKALIIDIGGGSVEFILSEGRKLLWRKSFEIGGLRLMEKFHQTDPIPHSAQTELNQWLDLVLADLKAVIQLHKPHILVGCSGSFDTLVEMAAASKGQVVDVESIPKFLLSLPEFDQLKNQIVKADRQQRLALPGMIPLRVEMMPVAVLLIQYVLDLMENPHIRVSTYSMKEGAFYHYFNTVNE